VGFHIIDLFAATGELLLVCQLCHKTFVDEYIVQAHIQHVHCADYRYSCQQCGRGFWRNSTFTTHTCMPAERDSNVEKRRLRAEKIAQLQQLNKPLYATVNPFACLIPYEVEGMQGADITKHCDVGNHLLVSCCQNP